MWASQSDKFRTRFFWSNFEFFSTPESLESEKIHSKHLKLKFSIDLQNLTAFNFFRRSKSFFSFLTKIWDIAIWFFFFWENSYVLSRTDFSWNLEFFTISIKPFCAVKAWDYFGEFLKLFKNTADSGVRTCYLWFFDRGDTHTFVSYKTPTVHLWTMRNTQSLCVTGIVRKRKEMPTTKLKISVWHNIFDGK